MNLKCTYINNLTHKSIEHCLIDSNRTECFFIDLHLLRYLFEIKHIIFFFVNDEIKNNFEKHLFRFLNFKL